MDFMWESGEGVYSNALCLICPKQQAQVSPQSITLCVHTSALSREFHISQVRALVACSVNRDQGRDLEKSTAKIGNHVVPLCDTTTLTDTRGSAKDRKYTHTHTSTHKQVHTY